jgi:hypothetical protein
MSAREFLYINTPQMQTLTDVHTQAAAAQKNQARTVATHKTAKPEIPSDWGCAGTCSQPPPAAPAGSKLQKRQVPEFFAPYEVSHGPHPVHITTIVATVAVITGLTLLVSWRGRRR